MKIGNLIQEMIQGNLKENGKGEHSQNVQATLEEKKSNNQFGGIKSYINTLNFTDDVKKEINVPEELNKNKENKDELDTEM